MAIGSLWHSRRTGNLFELMRQNVGPRSSRNGRPGESPATDNKPLTRRLHSASTGNVHLCPSLLRKERMAAAERKQKQEAKAKARAQWSRTPHPIGSDAKLV